MDPIFARAQKVSSASKASSKKSKSRRKKREGKGKKAKDAGQIAGQPSAAEEALAPRAASTREGSSARRKKREGRGKTTGDAAGQNAARTLAAEETSAPRAASRGDSSPLPLNESSSIAESRAASCTVGALHVVDAMLGLALVVYGGMVHVAQATAAAVCFGLLLFLGAVAGAVGHCSGACSNRRGLWASAAAGLVTCLLDVTAFVLVLVSWNSFVQFLNNHREELLLSEDGVTTIDGLKIPMAVIFFFLSVLEGFRFCVMWAKAKATASSDQGSPLARASKSNNTLCDKFLSLFGLEKQKKIDDFVVLDDDASFASLERSLLWSVRDESTPGDYLRFVPEHERGLTDFAEKASMPAPPQDRIDY